MVNSFSCLRAGAGWMRGRVWGGAGPVGNCLRGGEEGGSSGQLAGPEVVGLMGRLQEGPGLHSEQGQETP